MAKYGIGMKVRLLSDNRIGTIRSFTITEYFNKECKTAYEVEFDRWMDIISEHDLVIHLEIGDYVKSSIDGKKGTVVGFISEQYAQIKINGLYYVINIDNLTPILPPPMFYDIARLQFEAWKTAEDKGFHDNTDRLADYTLAKLALVHTEISEAAQEVKRHWVNGTEPTTEQLETFAEELADAVIRIADLTETVKGNLQKAIKRKMIKNKQRPYRYGTPDAV